MHLKKQISFLFVVLIAMSIGCSSSESFYSDSNEDVDSSENSATGTDTDEDITRLMISSLSDTYASNSNNIPPSFSEIKKEVAGNIDLTKGFRIQIYSGKDVYQADTVASQFRAWSDTTIVGYQAETYTFFKTPYYRVHIGDFHDRDRAFMFSKMVKRLFKDAWLVHDSVDPFRVPEDTTQIKFQEL